MKKRLLKTIIACAALCLAFSVSAAAAEVTDYSDDVTIIHMDENLYENSALKPCIINGRTMVPLDGFKLWFDEKDITYNPETKVINFQGGMAYMRFTLDSPVMEMRWWDGKVREIELDVPAMEYNGVIYFPYRAFCQMMNIQIDWDNSAREVHSRYDWYRR